MSDKKIDYDALARSARADTSAVDYDALAAQARQPNSPTTFRTPTQGQLTRKPLEMALGALPLAGGIAGGIIVGGAGLAAGGPWGAYGGEVLGSGMGGAAGKAASQAIGSLMGVPIPESQLGDIAREGAGQAAGAAIGRPLAMGAEAVAKPIMGAAIRATESLGKKFPAVDVAKTALKERVPVGSFRGEPGSRQAEQKVWESSRDLGIVLRNYRGKFSVNDLAKDALDKARAELKRPLSIQETRQILQSVKNRSNELLADRRFGVGYRPGQSRYSAREVKAIKQTAQDNARTVYSTAGNGRNPNANPMLDTHIASSAQKTLATRIPKVAELEAKTQANMALAKALRAAEHRHIGLGVPFVGGAMAAAIPDALSGRALHGLGALALIRAAESPRLQSRAALALTDPLMQQLLKQSPKVLAALYGASAQPDATQP